MKLLQIYQYPRHKHFTEVVNNVTSTAMRESKVSSYEVSRANHFVLLANASSVATSRFTHASVRCFHGLGQYGFLHVYPTSLLTRDNSDSERRANG